MYCKKCDNEIEKIQTDKHVEPLLVLKPKFVPMIAVLSGAIIPAICFTGFGMLLFGNIFAGTAQNFNLPPWFTYVFFACLCLLTSISLTFWIMIKTGESTEYRFYATELIYVKGFFTIEKKTVAYQDISEIILEDEAAQKMCGVGTIVLSTPSMNKSTGIAHSGVYIPYIAKPDEAYRQIDYILDRAGRKAA